MRVSTDAPKPLSLDGSTQPTALSAPHILALAKIYNLTITREGLGWPEVVGIGCGTPESKCGD